MQAGPVYPALGYFEFCVNLQKITEQSSLHMGSSKSLHHQRYRIFLTRLRRARKEAGLTQAELAVAIGKSQTWVSKCELGERRVDFVELEDIASAFGKPVDWFKTSEE